MPKVKQLIQIFILEGILTVIVAVASFWLLVRFHSGSMDGELTSAYSAITPTRPSSSPPESVTTPFADSTSTQMVSQRDVRRAFRSIHEEHASVSCADDRKFIMVAFRDWKIWVIAVCYFGSVCASSITKRLLTRSAALSSPSTPSRSSRLRSLPTSACVVTVLALWYG